MLLKRIIIIIIPVFSLLLVLTGAEQQQQQQQSTNTTTTTTTTLKRQSKRKGYYVCPPDFIRLSHRCYYFSKDPATWQDAYFHCRDLHSNLAIIRNANQDKLIRRTLNRKTLKPLERWLGGRYDWEQMAWKWAVSGKPVQYQSFGRINKNDKEYLKWHCIIVDPKLQYRWNSRSCLDRKHYICQTRLRTVHDRDKKKLLRQYNVTKFNQLNEVPVPVLPQDYNINHTNAYPLKGHQLNPSDINTDAAEYAMKPKQRKRKKTGKRNRKLNKEILDTNDIDDRPQHEQAVITTKNNRNNDNKQKRRQKYENDKEMSMEWKLYFKDAVKPYHPKPIVEEFNYIKDS